MPSGKNHVNWKGGISGRPHKVKRLIKKLILEKKSCKDCGNTENLQGHNIISYLDRPDLGDCSDNIDILCIFCHAKKHPDLSKFILKGVKYE